MGFALSILFVIFGGAYYLIRYLIESGEEEGRKKRFENEIKAKHDLTDLVSNEEFDNEINTLLREDYSQASCKSRKIAGNQQWYSMIEHNSELYNLIIHADAGKLSFINAYFGLPCNSIQVRKDISYDESAKARSRCILWATDQVNKNGAVVKVVVRHHINQYRDLTEDCLFSYADNAYEWKPI